MSLELLHASSYTCYIRDVIDVQWGETFVYVEI